MAAPEIVSWNDRQVGKLRDRFPDWDIWYVVVYMGPDIWCARPKGHPVATINKNSVGELVEAIGEQSAALKAAE